VIVETVAHEDWGEEDPPVVLSNPRLFRPFEKLIALLPLPRYGTIDPTPFVAVFFPLIFGLMLGDDLRPSLPMDRVIANELEIFGSHGIQAHRYPELLAMIGAGKLKPEMLIGRTISLEDSLVELPNMNSFSGIGVKVINQF